MFRTGLLHSLRWAGFFWICIPALLMAQDGGFTFKQVAGKVLVEGSKPAELNKTYPSGTGVSTGTASTAVIDYKGSTATVSPNSKMTVKLSGDSVTLQLARGGAEVDKQPSLNRFDVETPTAVCGARGTRFKVTYDPDPKTRKGTYSVSKSSVFVRARQGNTLEIEKMEAGKSVTASLLPGSQNAAGDISLPSGTRVSLGGEDFNTSGNTSVSMAKAMGSSQGVLVVNNGSLGGLGTGKYLTGGGKPTAVPAKSSKTADEYLALAKAEGRIKGQIDNGARGLEGDLEAAAEAATKKRQELFDRALIRETAGDAIRGALGR